MEAGAAAPGGVREARARRSRRPAHEGGGRRRGRRPSGGAARGERVRRGNSDGKRDSRRRKGRGLRQSAGRDVGGRQPPGGDGRRPIGAGRVGRRHEAGHDPLGRSAAAQRGDGQTPRGSRVGRRVPAVGTVRMLVGVVAVRRGPLGVIGRRNVVGLGPGPALLGRHAAAVPPAILGARAAARVVHAGIGSASVLGRGRGGHGQAERGGQVGEERDSRGEAPAHDPPRDVPP